ncbi:MULTISPECIES: hypothetical protein [unclassified Pseudomonas]|uniref:hypothetical protein n=1 Tax=unclassified Pseudomonas TaxID=196821 RepID=UPI000C8842B7|nr:MULTISPECIES: hypothetical protein [unclassified Pseudomonas]PMZ89978.1 hypothetical protein C1X61_09445 [Pseudomonas sp. FW215-T2]PNA12518.1 hypothetical protein C1X62_12380 [Pseudomonas sp. FW215-R3]PNB35423.1 hypothetical protein C1X63_22350 [Pseudomonas sp. FW305-131]
MVKSSSVRSSRNPEMPPPEIDGLLPDVPGGETNLLPEALTHSDLKVWFTVAENSHPDIAEETVELFVDGNPNALVTRRWSQPIDDTDRYLLVPQAWLRNNDGEHLFNYRVTIFNGEAADSFDLPLTLDTQQPLLAADSKLIFPPEVLPPNAITAAYLADPANNDQVLATLPDYNTKKVGDVISVYWETSPGGQQVAYTKTLAQADLGKPVQVAFSGDLLRRANGNFFATYRVRDRAGNGDDVLSRPVELIVNIRPPTPRKFPTVKEASSTPAGTGVLNPFRGVNGITVVVPKDEIDPGEEVTVDFIGLGGESGVGSVVGVRPTVTGGLEFAIAAAIVAANIPVQGDGRKVEVRYRAGTSVSATFTLSIDEISSTSFGSVECDKAQIGSPATLSKATVAQSGANIQIEEWAYHTDSQLINVWAVAASVPTDFLTAGPTPISGGGKFSTPLPKDYVAALTLNSTFTLYAGVSFDQGYSYRPFRAMQIKVIV